MSQTLLTIDGKILTTNGKLILPEVNLQEKTVTPSKTAQVIQPDNGYTGLSRVNVPGISIVDLATPTINVSSTGLITANLIQPEGYISGGTASSTKQLEIQAAQTITPSTSNKTIASGRYLTGTQTIKGDSNLIASNIKSGVSIFGVSGSLQSISDTYAIISVTYPSDSTCTCKKGSVVASFMGGSGSGFFCVPSSGTWTVSCTNGTDSTSQTISITTMWEVKNVILKYTQVLYNAGNQYTGVTGGWATVGDAALEANAMQAWSSWQTSGFYTKNSLSYIGFSKVCVTFEYYESSTRISISDNTTLYADGTAKVTQYANATTTIMAIGTVTSGYLRIAMDANQGFKVTKVWLES